MPPVRTGRRSSSWILALLLMAGGTPLAAQQPETGLFYQHLFLPGDYDAHPQNWNLAQGPGGLVYVANNNGILIYDGARWEKLATPNGSILRGLAVDSSGRIYLGGQREFGYYDYPSGGPPSYTSLARLLPEGAKVGDVWRVFLRPEGVYFQASQGLFLWRPGEDQLQVWRPRTSFHRAFLVEGHLYLDQPGVGLMRLESGELVLASDRFRKGRLNVLLSLGEGRLLAGSDPEGLFLFSGGRWQPFGGAALERLSHAWLYSGLRLADGRLALGTIREGLFLLDGEGRLLRHLPSGSRPVLGLMQDREGGLWASLDGGILRLEVTSPLSFFDRGLGLRGTVWALARHAGDLYAATNLGIFRLQPGAQGEVPRFRLLPALEGQQWALLETPWGLLVGGQEGLRVLRQGSVRKVLEGRPVRSLASSELDPNRVLAVLKTGLAVLEWEGSGWRVRYRREGLAGLADTVREEEDGTLWLGSLADGAFRFLPRKGSDAGYRVERFQLDYGNSSTAERYIHPFQLGGRTVFGTGLGLYRYQPGSGLVSDDSLGARFASGGKSVFRLAQDSRARVWVRSDQNGVVLPGPGGSRRWETRWLARMPPRPIYAIRPEADAVWLGTVEGLVRYDLHVPAPTGTPFRALLRRLSPVGEDQVLYGGKPGQAGIGRPLDPEQNALRFTFAAPTFDLPEATRFRYRLRGFDGGWSRWSEETRKDYTNLPAGSYIFEVEARNLYGRVGRTRGYAFRIRPHWYQSGWAWALYLLAGGGLLALGTAGTVRWRSARLEARNRELERAVEERTRQVEAQKRRIEGQNRELVQLEEARSRFFANVTHEFRTPLTLTIGPLEDLQTGLHGDLDGEVRSQIDTALESSRRLLSLVNQILELARLESGRLRLRAEELDFLSFVRTTAESYRSLAERQGQTLEVKLPRTPLLLYFDPPQMEKVVGNLISNALKFTPPGGTIRVRLELSDRETITLEISDNGPGIEAEDLEHVFDRFYRGRQEAARHPGSGIGLALVRELVEMHGGRVEAESPPGQGCTFRIHLKRGAHLRAEDLALPGSHAPWGSEKAAASAAPAPESDSEDLEGEKDRPQILVIDDNRELRAFIRKHFEREYRVLEAGDGREGLEQARRHLPDLVLCDVMMPRMNGYDFCRELKGDPDLDSIPVILLTALAETEDVVSGLAGGADDYVRKPFNGRELEARVRGLIESRRRLKARFSTYRMSLPAPEGMASGEERFLEQLRAQLEEHLEENDFTVGQLARNLGMDRTGLYRRLRDLLGETPAGLIRRLRLERAAQLLEARAGTVTEVAYSVGYSSLSNFARSFRQQYGCPPSRYPGRQ